MGCLRPWEGTIYAVMRIPVGLLFMERGLQKILGMFRGSPRGTPAALLYLSGAIERGLLVAMGLQAPLAAFVCSGMMAVAYFMVHAPKGLFPIEYRGELAILWIFLLVAGRGAGSFSLDREWS